MLREGGFKNISGSKSGTGRTETLCSACHSERQLSIYSEQAEGALWNAEGTLSDPSLEAMGIFKGQEFAKAMVALRTKLTAKINEAAKAKR